jgi:tetratricopeptide (TPR) repeat protein
MAIDLKAVGPFLAAAAGYAVLGPEGGTLGAILGGDFGAILPGSVAELAKKGLSSAANDYLKERIPDMLEDWKKNQADESRIQLNHTILQALANSIAEQIEKAEIPGWPHLPKAWSTALQKVAEDPNKLPALFRASSEGLYSNTLSEAEILAHLSQPAELEKLFWSNLKDYLVRVIDHPNIIATNLPAAARTALTAASDGVPKLERISILERLKPQIFEGLTRAYAQQVAGDQILRDKSLFHLAQATGEKLGTLEATFMRLLQENNAALISALSGKTEPVVIAAFQTAISEAVVEIKDHASQLHKETIEAIEGHGGFVVRPLFVSTRGNLIERPELMTELESGFTTAANRAITALAAHGDGGVGKSVLAELYAISFKKQHAQAIVLWFDMSNRADLAEVFASYHGTHSVFKTAGERAVRVATALAQPPTKLVVLDNVEDAEHWLELQMSGLLPGANCQILVTTQDQAILPQSQVVVRKLAREEAIRLLESFVPEIRQSNILEIVLSETHQIAVFLAAVAATIQIDPTNLEEYGEWLIKCPVSEMDQDAQAPGYPKKGTAILQKLRDALAPPALRALDLAAFLPVGGFPLAWLEELLGKFHSQPGLNWQTTRRGTVNASFYVQDLVKRRLLEEVPGSDRYRLHRVHRRYAQELLTDPAEQARLLSPVFALAECLFTVADEDRHHSIAVPNLTDFIAIQEELGKFLSPQYGWDPQSQNDLAKAYMNRGNAQQDVPDINAAIRDYGSAIEIREKIRDILEPQGRWAPWYQNYLAKAYGSRGNAHQALPDINAAIRDYESAIEVMEHIRDTLKPQGRWDSDYQNDLSKAYTNRGVAQQAVPDINAAITDFGSAIEIREQIRDTLKPQGKWDPQYQDDLATTYMQRGNAHRALPDINAAMRDYESAIEVMEQIRDALETQGRWDPQYQNALASTFVNRGRAQQAVHKISAAIRDYGSATKVMEHIRDTLEPQGRWDPKYQADLAATYIYRAEAYLQDHQVPKASAELLRSGAVLWDLIGKYLGYFEGLYLKCVAILHLTGDTSSFDGKEAIRLCEQRLSPAQLQAANFEKLANIIRQALQ